MNIQLNKSFFIIIVLLITTAILAYHTALWRMKGTGGSDDDASRQDPLYWVAPMDPNYKRDKPGKSPMGMDLIPVYEESGGDQDVGTVTISPEVVNNLGVRTAPATRGQLESHVNTVGYVQYDEDHLIHIHPRVEGWVEKLYVKAAGDPVEQGSPLYAIYSPTLVNAQEELLLAQKRNNQTLVEAAVERLSALQVPESEINRLKKSGKVSQTITIRAPQSGVLDNLTIREGMFVKPGMEMMAIGQLQHIWVIAEVFERQVLSVREGDAVRMHLDYLPGREWTGKVDYIYPALNTRTRTARVRVRFDNPDNFLRPGMFAQMVIATGPTQETLLIPGEALIRTGSQSRVVLAKGDGRFKSISVEVGRIGENRVEILSGLEEGDRIVTSAQFLIDSESSKTSDFRRMDQGSGVDDRNERPASVWVGARIESLMYARRMLRLAHDPIDAWQWPAMTMDFVAAPSVEMEGLQPGMNLHVEISRDGDNSYLISQIDRPESMPEEAPMGGDGQSMDKSQHQGVNLDAMNMDHSERQDRVQRAMEKDRDAMEKDRGRHGETGNP